MRRGNSKGRGEGEVSPGSSVGGGTGLRNRKC